MALKMRTITLYPEYDVGALIGYRVVKITNDVHPSPGDFVNIPLAMELCKAKSWTVHIVGRPPR